MEKCRICGRVAKNDSVSIRLLGTEATDICEVCAGKIYLINFTKDKSVYDREVKWLRSKWGELDDETQLLLKAKVKERTTELETIQENNIRLAETNVKAKTFWTSVIKFVSVCEIVLLAIIGGFIGYTLSRFGDDTVYTIAGVVLGGFIGAVLSALNMFIVEVAQNIASCVNLLSKIASKE